MAQTKPTQVTIGIGSGPSPWMGATIVDWTTNAQIENVYDLLFTRDPKDERIIPWLATGYKVVDEKTWSSRCAETSGFTMASGSMRMP